MKRTLIKLFAFTLSELLVTLSIIGVVSALTVPTLINKYQAQANVAQLRKAYFDIGQAVDLMLTDEAKTTISATTLAATPGKFLKKYLRINQDCGTNMTPCFAASYKNIDGGKAVTLECEDGYTISTTAGFSTCICGTNPASVLIDINGPDKPNIAGRDLFSFSIYDDGSIDEALSPADKTDKSSEDITKIRNDKAAECTGGEKNAVGCFTKILNANWKMDY